MPLTISLSKRPYNPMIALIKKAACAPVEESRMFTQGYGDDVIAIPFDANGRVTFAPVYIYTIRPENSQRWRMEALTEGVTSQVDVRRLLTGPRSKNAFAGMRYGFTIRVYNPFEEFLDMPPPERSPSCSRAESLTDHLPVRSHVPNCGRQRAFSFSF